MFDAGGQVRYRDECFVLHTFGGGTIVGQGFFRRSFVFLSIASALITILVFMTGLPTLKDYFASDPGAPSQPRAGVAEGGHAVPQQGVTEPANPPRTVPKKHVQADTQDQGVDDLSAAEATYWRNVHRDDIASLQSYLDRYPNGVYAATARTAIAVLQRRATAPVEFTGQTSRFVDSQHGFSLNLPQGWQLQESADVEAVHRTMFRSPRFDSERASCLIITGRLPDISRTQDELDASVMRGELEVSMRDNDIQKFDPQAVLEDHSIIHIGDLLAQNGHVSLVAEGLRIRMRRIITVVAPGNLFMVSCLAPANLYPKNEAEFETVLNTFRVTGH